jgi:glycosyltransferase involved in cell wall biosynthesis
LSRPGFNFFGHVTGHFGLGHSARATLAWLLQEGQPVCVRDVVTLDGRSGPIPRFDAHVRRQPWGLPFDVNFFHLNPPEMLRHLALEWQLLPIERRLNVALPFWELPSVPPPWLDLLAAMDLVLAPTRFIQSVLLDNAPGMRCLHFPFVMDLPRSAPTDRGRFGLPEGALVFLSAFDVGSDIERKNPWAAIKAFQVAFAGQEAVRLVIKLTQPRGWSCARAQLEKLRQIIQTDPRLMLIDEHLPRPDLLTLFASCDVLVSLHRAEGLGNILMEMMALGKPVVATAWSGNMDFTTSNNACLVDYDMVPVQAVDLIFRQECARAAPQWAEPRIPSAAAWMRRLHDEPDLRARIGEQAAEDMRQRCASGREGMLDKIKATLFSPEVRAGHQARSRWLYRQRVRGLAQAFRLSPPGFARRIGSVVRDAILSHEPDRQTPSSSPPRD